MPVFCVFAAVRRVLIAHDTRQRVFLHPAEESNPYAYAHTSDDILGLPSEIAELARQEGINTPRIAVIAADPWPLPWYLRRCSKWAIGSPASGAAADFYITSTDAAESVCRYNCGLPAGFFRQPPGVLILLWLPSESEAYG